MARTALVTGGSRGIGAAISIALKDAGYNVAANYAGNDEAAAKFKAETGIPVFKWSVADYDACADGIGKVEAEVGPIDVLVNNAGLERATPLDGPDPETDAVFDRIIDVNIRGTRNVTRATVTAMPAGARILLTASIWGRTAVPDFSAYVASKHAIIGLARTWAQELGPRGIRVNAICPGWVRTQQAMRTLAGMAEEQQRSEQDILSEVSDAQALDGVMEPADVAGLYLFLGSDAAANITGQAINVDRGEVMS